MSIFWHIIVILGYLASISAYTSLFKVFVSLELDNFKVFIMDFIFTSISERDDVRE